MQPPPVASHRWLSARRYTRSDMRKTAWSRGLVLLLRTRYMYRKYEASERSEPDVTSPIARSAAGFRRCAALNWSIICSTPKKRLIDVRVPTWSSYPLVRTQFGRSTTCAASICAPCFSRSSVPLAPTTAHDAQSSHAPRQRPAKALELGSCAANGTNLRVGNGFSFENCSCAATSSRLHRMGTAAASRTSRCFWYTGGLSAARAQITGAPRVRLRRDVAGHARVARPEPERRLAYQAGGAAAGAHRARKRRRPPLRQRGDGVALHRRRRRRPRRGERNCLYTAASS